MGGWIWWSRMNLSLSQDKKEVIERNVKLQTDLATAYQQVRRCAHTGGHRLGVGARRLPSPAWPP